MVYYAEKATGTTINIQVVASAQLDTWLQQASGFTKNWVASLKLNLKKNQVVFLPTKTGSIDSVLAILTDLNNLWEYACIPKALTSGEYVIDTQGLSAEQYSLAVLAWGLANYQFQRYTSSLPAKPVLIIDLQAYKQSLSMFKAISLVRDLINTPTEDMGPEHLAKATSDLAESFNAQFKQVVGDELVAQNYPAIYAVGRASHRESRLLELLWGDENAPKLTLVGKGVCFDTGGLDLKPSSFMRHMKKDMGGAAHVLGLAYMIMSQQLPVRLRVLIPAVENAIGGNAYRPGDVLQTRKGISVEVGNTDAEGRLVLADALADACEEKPDLLIDMATLTGAARVALGTDIPVFFTNQQSFATDLSQQSMETKELVWPLPLYSDYREYLNSSVADISNDSSSRYGGAIAAAIFLQEFIQENVNWLHFDIMAWNTKSKPGRPEGGEAMGLRTLYRMLEQRYTA